MSGDTTRKLPDGWRWVRLGEICEVVTGCTPSKSNIEYYGGNIPWIKPDDLDKEKYVSSSLEKLTELGGKQSRLLPEGSVLVSCIGKLGKTAIAGCCLATNQQINALIPSECIDSEYLYYACKLIGSNLYKLAATTIIPILNKTNFASIEIPLPPLPEQKRIVAMLDEQLAAVEKAKRAAEEQFTVANALLYSYMDEVFNNDTYDFHPMRIGSLSKTCTGATPSRQVPEYYGGDIPWIKTGELKDGVIRDVEEFITEKALQESSVKLLPPETLLVAMYGQGQTRGRTGLLSVAGTTNQACFAVLPNPARFSTRYLQWWFRYRYDELRKQSEGRGGSQPNLNSQILNDLIVPIPSVSNQQEIVKYLDDIEKRACNLINYLDNQIHLLAEIKDGLIVEAFAFKN